MDKYSRFLPLIISSVLIFAAIIGSYQTVWPLYEGNKTLQEELADAEAAYTKAEKDYNERKQKAERMNTQRTEVVKKIYAPAESDLDKDSLFFNLYTDVIDIAKQNGIKIRSIDYNYYPATDNFVALGGKDNYFVCDLDMKLISNYTQLRNFVETLFQYPFYVKFNKLVVEPYKLDKKVLMTDFSLRLYARTDIEKPGL